MGQALGTDQRRFDWPRFWVKHGGTISLSDAGYLADPDRALSRSDLCTLQDLSELRAIALLGEPGMGKSIALDMEARRLRDAEVNGTEVFHADLRAYSSDVLLNAKVFESPTLKRWKEGTGHMVLFLDSLDEALLRIETVAAFIADELPRLPFDRLSVRIACRTLDWHAVAPTIQPVFQSLWGTDAIGVYEIAPLRRKDVAAAAAAWPVDADRFMEQIWAASVVPFAIKPLTLILLLRLFHTDGQLPDGIAELYRRGCLSLCEEQSASRRAPRREGHLAPAERARLAGRIAAVSMLANRYAVWTGLESGIVPLEDVTISTLSVGDEPFEARALPVTRDALREVLDTGLFSSRGEDRMGWAHQSYAEFLAADYLIARRVPTRNILDMLCHPAGGLVPQLAMVAAWAASLDEDIRRELIECEPIVLLHGDLTGWSDSDRSLLATALLKALNDDRAHDFEFGLHANYRKLAHPALIAILRPYIVDSGRKVVARRVAIRVAEVCRLTGLREDLLAVALDGAEAPCVRGCTVSALKTCGDTSTWAALRPLALGGAGADPKNQIKGHAISILWPDQLDAETLFQNITPPRENFYGAYANFLTHTLPETLQRADLPAALRWSADFARGSGGMGNFICNRLADAILRRAWPYVQDPEITPLVLDHALAAIQKHYKLTIGLENDDDRAFREDLARDTVGRRALLRAAISARIRDHFAHWLVQSGLLLREDLGWLLDLAPGSPNAADDLDEVTLLNFVQKAANLSYDADFAAIYDAAQCWPLLYSNYDFLIGGVALDSSQAAQMRERHQWIEQLAQIKPPKVDPPPEIRVANWLDRFEAGDLNAWWLLFPELTLNEDSTHYGEELNYEISKQPGWVGSSSVVRRRIMDAARVFLDQAGPTIVQWMGTNSVNYSDQAAYRALLLLREEDPEAYRKLGSAVWTKWAPLVVTIPKNLGAEWSQLIHDALTAEAVAAAPGAVADTLATLIRMERDRSPPTDQPQGSQLPAFYFLNQLKPDLACQPIILVLLRELEDPRNTAEQYGVLLGFLVRAGSCEAISHALAKFEPWPCPPEQRDITFSAAATLLEEGAIVGWGPIWAVVVADQDFGQSLFLRIAHRHRIGAAVFAALTESQLGDLYVWLEQTFPRRSEPEHGGVHWVSPLESVGQLRENVLSVLVKRGTPKAVSALRSVMARLPALDWLAPRFLEADQIMRQRTWAPLTPAAVLRLVENTEGRLVQSPEQLANLLVEVLRAYEKELHGEQLPVNALWNREPGGKEMWPKDEDILSDHVKLYLQRVLVKRGVVLNREVEIGRVSGAGIGSRTDIRVDAVRRSPNGDCFDVITAIIETKGCWNPDVKTAIETQLRDDYLVRTDAPVGIYLVGWFDKAKWRVGDHRRRNTPNWDVAEAKQFFDTEAARLTGGFVVRAVVLDCHAP